jgi:hypothetical protein
MPDTIPKLPGLTGKPEAELHKIYDEVIGGQLGAEFDTVPKVIAEIKRAYAEKYPEPAVASAAAATAEDAVPEGYIAATKEGRVKYFPEAVWAAYGANTQGWERVADKPASLPKA